jgi:hypothetical protein
MKMPIRCAAIVLLEAWRALGSAAWAGEGTASVAAGERIYRDGTGAGGRQLRAVGVNGMKREGKEAACASCHRRSGFGSVEGPFVVRPITAADLFQDRAAKAATLRIARQLGKPLRAPYDDASLAAAIRNGTDVSGNMLDHLMPRYTLEQGEMRDLLAYLRALGTSAPVGVDDEDVHFASVIQPGVAPSRRAALVAVLEAFVRDKNAQVRSEPARRRAGAMRMHRSYRRWFLHIWQLHGPEQGWGTQLARYYAEQPVFALVSGVGDLNWSPIHRFSELHRLPCILPVAALPDTSAPNFYTLYFSAGARLEGEGLARHLRATLPGGVVNQIYRADDPAARAAAHALRAQLEGTPFEVRDRLLPTSPATVVEWTDTATVVWAAAAELSPRGVAGGGTVFLARSSNPQGVPPGWGPALMFARWDNGQAHQRRLRRIHDWMAARRIAVDDEELQVNALFAMSMVGEAMMHMQDSFSREYLMELIEHDVNVTLLPSMYPRLSLGRDLRVAAHEVYVDALPGPVSASAPGGVP